MSTGKKRSIAEGDTPNGRHSKRSKTAVGSAPIAQEAGDGASREREDKHRKKHKKSKSDKTDREKVKKSKEKEVGEEGEGEQGEKEEEGAPAIASVHHPAEEQAQDAGLKQGGEQAKSRRDKKSKKEKKKSKDGRKTKSLNAPEGDLGTDEEPVERTTLTGPLDAPRPGVPESEVGDFLASQQVAISDPRASGKEAPPQSIVRFDQLPSSRLLSKKPFAAFTTPTPIQAVTWPFSLAGRDVIGIAETGSGKTVAFALPCIEALLLAKSSEADAPRTKKGGRARDSTVHPRAVIVAPTRELAMQTHATMSDLAALVGLSAVCLYGGSSKDGQRVLLRQSGGADIVVATPGRLKDLLSEGCLSLSAVAFAVLDEADRMLDKGFEEEIKLILGSCPARGKKQTLMFTATWPTSVRGLAEGFMVEPVKVTIGSKSRARAGGDGEDQDGEAGDDAEDGDTIELQANNRIEQVVEVVEPRGKEQRLLQLLQAAQRGGGRNDRILVFCLYKKEAVRVEQFLEHKGIHVASIHGDLRQEQRTRSLDAFKAGTTSVLVATDVAARGLDIPEVKLVINLTFPLTIEDYVHRIGRTGRAGKTGKAITLFTEYDKAHSGSLVNILRGAKQPVPEELLKFGTGIKKKTHDAYGAFFKNVDMSKKGTKITFD